MDVSTALNILVCPSAAASTRQVISEATAVLGNADSEKVITALSEIAFNEQEAIERREGALVLLRSRLVAWDPSQNPTLKQAIQQALSTSLMSATDPLLAWRVASVVSALFCSQSNPHAVNWQELYQSVVVYLEGIASNSNTSANFSALTLIKAIYADGGYVEALTSTFPKYLKTVLSRGWNTPDLHKLTCEATGAVIQSYTLHAPAVPVECSELLDETMTVILNCQKSELWTLLSDMVEVLVATIDVRPTEAGLWTPKTVASLLRCLEVCVNYDALAKKRSYAQVEGTVAQHLLHVATSAVLALSEESTLQASILEPLWNILVACLSLPVPGPSLCTIEDIAMFWELRRDDEECTVSIELPDESPDLSMVAWEEFDRLLTDMEPQTARTRVFSTAEKLLSSNTGSLEGLGAVYAGWVLLAILLGAKVDGLTRPMFSMALDGWSRCVSVQPPQNADVATRLVAARVRWGALLFMNEIFANYGDALAAEPTAMNILQLLQTNAAQERVPRVKTKCWMTFCQLAAQMNEVVGKEGRYQRLINAYYVQWLLPSLVTPRLLDECSSLVSGTFDLTDDDTKAMETLLRELALAAMSTTCTSLGPGLAEHYGPVMTHCLHLLSCAPADEEAATICEAVVEFATRLVECVGLVLVESSEEAPVPESLMRASDDSVRLLREIVRLDLAVQTLNNDGRKSVIKAGMFSSSFERTLLQAAARVIAVVNSAEVATELRAVLAIVQRKLTVNDVVSISDSVSSKPLGAAGYSLETSERCTTLTFAHVGGLDKVININSTLIEEQVASLSFLGVTAEKIIPILQPAEVTSMLFLIGNLTKSSILPDVRRSGVECLKEVIEIFAENVRKSARDAAEKNCEPSSDAQFLAALKQYMDLWIELMGLSHQVATSHPLKLKNMNELVYTIADMSDGARDSALIVRQTLTELNEGMKNSLFDPSVVQNLITELSRTFFRALAADDKVNSTSPMRLDDDDDEEDTHEEYFGIACDAVMQFLSRTFKAFGMLANPGFKALETIFAALISMEDVTVVSRTASLVLFASAADARRGHEDNERLLPVAMLFCRPQEVDSRLKGALPSIEKWSTLAKAERSESVPDIELMRPCLSLLRSLDANAEGKDDDQIIEDFIDEHQTEVMRIQAALYAVGVLALSCKDFKTIENQLPAIEEVFTSLLNHPLACLASRRVILDCLTCASLRIMMRMSDFGHENRKGLFSIQGLFSILSTLVPLRDDAEDAQATHDLLIDWAMGRVPSFPLPASENLTPQNVAATKACLEQVQRVLAGLRDGGEENGELLSFRAKYMGDLDRALAVLTE